MAPNPDKVPKPYDDLNPPFKTEWPGVTFAKGTQQFKALMGTAHGVGIVWLIVKHPDQMPGKDIKSVTMFVTRNEDLYLYNPLFTPSD